MLKLRMGYNNHLNANLNTDTGKNFGGLSGGLGIYWKSFRFDYAVSNFGSLGIVHRIGIHGRI